MRPFLSNIAGLDRIIPQISPHTPNYSNRVHEFVMTTIYQFYLFPILWYVFATVVAFIAALVFWKKGPTAMDGQIPGVPVTLKFTGAAAIFVGVVIVFHFINPVRSFNDYTKIYIVVSDKPLSPSSDITMDWHITQTQLSTAGFDADSTSVQMVPSEFVYDLTLRLEDKSFTTNSPIPKGKYKLRLTSSKQGVPTREYTEEVK